MPLYEYKCVKCGKHFERIEKFEGPNLKKCPSCGGRVERLLSAPAIQFKGSGWYVTDYAKPKSDSEQKSSASAAEKNTGKSESSGDKSSEKPSEKSSTSKETAKEKKKADAKK